MVRSTLRTRIVVPGPHGAAELLGLMQLLQQVQRRNSITSGAAAVASAGRRMICT